MNEQQHDGRLNTSGVSSGIGPADERFGSLEPGGVYLLAGRPGPAKLVAALQFLDAGIRQEEKTLLLTTSDGPGILDVARGWGFEMNSAWQEGRLEILGFREDFEMRILRAAVPEDAVEELDVLVEQDFSRVAIDPGSLFLHDGARTALARAFLEWARNHPATICLTFPIDSPDGLPSAAEWLVHRIDGVFLIERQPDGLYQIRLDNALPGPAGSEEPVTLQLKPGAGLVIPDGSPTRRHTDGQSGAADRLLILSLDEATAGEIETWAKDTFTTEIVVEPLDALARIQTSEPFGGVLIHTPRQRMREAIRTCRAMRPLTPAAIIVASDDSVRSTDRVGLLDAGADDCLSGGIDFRELGTRIQKAVSIGGQTLAPTTEEATEVGRRLGGLVRQEAFVEEAKRRAADPEQCRFSLVQFKATPHSRSNVEKVLAGELREDGDLVACVPDGCWVLLQGARRGPAMAFIKRAQKRIKESPGDGQEPDFTVLVNPADKLLIEVVLAKSDQPQDLTAAWRGSGEQEA